MIKIGDFANLFNVSIKTVRYYESMGLLIPKYVDIYTGYRYYDEDNIYTMQDIISLKNMGFSLEEIRHFSKDKINVDGASCILPNKFKEELWEK